MLINNGIVIREVEISDAYALIEYLKRVMYETNYLRMYPDEVKFTIKEEEDYIQMMLNQENSKLLLALDGEKIVSVASMQGQQLRKFRHCAEFGISVLQDYWRMGIGKALTNILINWSKENTVIKKIILHVNAENNVAIQLYENLGFVMEGKLANDFYYEGRFIDTYIYAMNV